MAATEAAVISILSSHLSPSSKFPLTYAVCHTIKLQNCIFSPHLSVKFPIHPLHPLLHSRARKSSSPVKTAVQEDVAVEEKAEETEKSDPRRKLYLSNIPWSSTVDNIKNLFSECGSVVDIEILKQKDGKLRGFAFVTMASGEEAQAALQKFNSYEFLGRPITVEFAKRFKKPARPHPEVSPSAETHYKLYVSNLAWKARSTHLREFFSANFAPVSARVVFDNPSGRSAGYGFVSFSSREEAQAALSDLDGKELLGRPIRLKFSERNVEEPKNGEQTAEGKTAEESESGGEEVAQERD